MQLRLWDTVFQKVVHRNRCKLSSVTPMIFKKEFHLSSNYRTTVEMLPSDPEFVCQSASIVKSVSVA